MSGPSGLFTMAASSARDTQYDAGARRIERLDYSLAEAAFLCRVAKVGGYFLRRQFLDFTGHHMGQTVVSFTGRLVQSGHATVEVLGRGTHVYHLSSRAIYLAAGCEDIKRLRRRRPPSSVKTCLMALDVLLAHLKGPRVLCDDSGEPLTQKMVQVVMKRVGRLANVKPGVHILRHTFCSHLAMRGVPGMSIKELAGHEVLSTTQRYMHLSPDAVEDAIRVLETPRFVVAGAIAGQ